MRLCREIAGEGFYSAVSIFFSFLHSDTRSIVATAEGAPEWIPVAALDDLPLVDDLYEVIPRALVDGPIFFGHYQPDDGGRMRYRFRL